MMPSKLRVGGSISHGDIFSIRLNRFYFAPSVIKDLMASWLDNDDILDTISGFFSK